MRRPDMEWIAMPEYINNETFSLLFDAVLVVAVVGLWIFWGKQMTQRKHIEQALLDASTQLQEATLILNQALQQIEQLQGGAVAHGAEPEAADRRDVADVKQDDFRRKVEARVQRAPNEQVHGSANISQVAQMLRLQREGVRPEVIAEKLNVPLAQIKLMLMLQSNPGTQA